MLGIKFGNYHSYEHLKLICVSKQIGSPSIKKKEVAVEGSSATLDYTECFGEVKYGKRKHTFKFKTVVPQSKFMSQYSLVQNALHGKCVRIILDEELEYYYIGRLTVSPLTKDKNVGQINIECDCEPWKYKLEETKVSVNVSGEKTINLTNSRKRVVPTITTDASITVKFGNDTTIVSAGTRIIPTLELSEGDNEVIVTGTGNITFVYQEGGL